MTEPMFYVEDVEFMARHGETWDAVVARLGVKRKTIERGLYRAERYDITALLAANSVTNESPYTHCWNVA